MITARYELQYGYFSHVSTVGYRTVANKSSYNSAESGGSSRYRMFKKVPKLIRNRIGKEHFQFIRRRRKFLNFEQVDFANLSESSI